MEAGSIAEAVRWYIEGRPSECAWYLLRAEQLCAGDVIRFEGEDTTGYEVERLQAVQAPDYVRLAMHRVGDKTARYEFTIGMGSLVEALLEKEA